MKLGKYIGQELLEDMVIVNTVVYTELDNTEYGRLIDSTWIISTHIMELINDELNYPRTKNSWASETLVQNFRRFTDCAN